MTIDRMDWHYGGEYPPNLPNENAGTHIGMYLAWIILNNLESAELHEGGEEELEKLRKREITGRDFLISNCDEKFWDVDLNSKGLEFTLDYYLDGENYGQYIVDYLEVFDDDTKEIFYELENTWENYDKIAPIISKRYLEWKKGR